MSSEPRPGFCLRIAWAALTATLTGASGAGAAEKASEQVSPFYGTFSHSIPIEAPPFHGLEPRLILAYNSEGRNGIVGVGWTLAGCRTIERANPGRGTPRFDASAIYLLDGQELAACVQGGVSPSCTSGGTHSTKIESYLKIRFDPPNTWTVWSRDGTRTVFSPIVQVTPGTLRWGQTSVVDTKNNTVTYSWNRADGDCYPGQVSNRVTRLQAKDRLSDGYNPVTWALDGVGLCYATPVVVIDYIYS